MMKFIGYECVYIRSGIIILEGAVLTVVSRLFKCFWSSDETKGKTHSGKRLVRRELLGSPS